MLELLGWMAPGGTSWVQQQWTEPNGAKVQKLMWPTQAEQVSFLRAVVDAYREREWLRQLAIHIAFDLYACPRKDKSCQALALGDWVQKNVTYVEELPERFLSPLRLLAQPRPAGDCDDFSVLIASLCEALGIRSRLVAAGWDGGYRHIWPEAYDNVRRRWVRLDATMRGPVGLSNPYKVLARTHPEAWILRV